MIKNNINYFKVRGLPEKQTKYHKKPNHLSFEPKIKLYDYYICDNCGKEIRIKNKWEQSEGGVAFIPKSITKSVDINLALCNKCFKLVLKEFEV